MSQKNNVEIINKDDIEKIKKYMVEHDEKNEQLIRKSRDVLKLSKHLINSIHRENETAADKFSVEINKEVAELKKMVDSQPGLTYSGSYKVAIQEYVEAVSFMEYVRNNKLPTTGQLDVGIEHYLLGICDLTGELVRKAINAVTKEDYQTAVKIRDFIDELYSFLIGIDFRNSELRRKFDSIKYDLKKLEDVVYELKLREKI